MTEIDNADLVAHEQRILAQIEHARKAYTVLESKASYPEQPDDPSNDDILSLLRFIADAGFRLEPDPEGVAAAARDHLEAERADFIAYLMDHLPKEVKDVIDAAKKAGMDMTVIPVGPDDCTNPNCPIHGDK